jgi:hypothetical protein
MLPKMALADSTITDPKMALADSTITEKDNERTAFMTIPIIMLNDNKMIRYETKLHHTSIYEGVTR